MTGALTSTRRFLYLSPMFPPTGRVGAMRPLKFSRHLPAFGWQPIVLADLPRGAPVDPAALRAVPPDLEVHRDWSRAASLGPDHAGAWTLRAVEALRRLFPSEDRLPLGHHRLDVAHALRAARRIVRAHPGCEAIVVNADPWSALIVGAKLARETGLPLVADLRDPWSCCELRMPHRLLLQQRWIERLERDVFETASAIILNTEKARRDYVALYPDIEPDRFHAIRNHGDRELGGGGDFAGFDRFTMLHLGTLRRFVTGESLVRALAGIEGEAGFDYQVVFTSELPGPVRRLAAQLGVLGRLREVPAFSSTETGRVIDAADLLLAIASSSSQRIPAKFYEYALSDRPIMALGRSAELGELLGQIGGADYVGLDDVPGISKRLEAALRSGRGRAVERRQIGLDSRTASERLAGILDRVTRERRGAATG